MIGISCKVTNRFNSLERKVQQANFKNLGHAAATLRMVARQSIRRRKKPSQPGSPPHTQTGRLKRSIIYSVDRQRQSAIIGPSHSIIGPAGAEHEHGGGRRKQRFPRRPYMGPALKKIQPRLSRMWASSIK